MINVLGCIYHQHDLILVALAAALCVAACAAAMSMLARARVAVGRTRAIWIACCGVVGGFGIWATHFVAMLAYRTSLPIGFEPVGTFLSMLVAAVMCGVGFWIAFSRLGGAVGGTVIGLAIATMHYIGMVAVQAPADQIWNFNYVAASVAIGTLPMAWGMRIVVQQGGLRSYVAGTAIFTLAICAMHFTGMTAFALRPDPAVVVPRVLMEPGTLAVGIAAVAFLAIALGLVAALFDNQQARLRDLKANKVQLEQLTDGLKVALEESLSAQRAKASFFAAMSHELRTPLNAIIGFSEMLEGQVFGSLGHPRNTEYVRDIHASGKRLLSLINDVLDMSRMDAGKMKLREQSISIDELLTRALRTMEPLAAKAGVRITKHIPRDLPQLTADAQRMEQVVLNLLSNAVKFSYRGGNVELSAYHDGSTYCVMVTDSGIGIAKADVPKVFERFGQIDNGLARKYEGAGLGLSISKQLVELHGGSLTIDSMPDVGTTVTVKLPAFRIETKAAVAGFA